MLMTLLDSGLVICDLGIWSGPECHFPKLGTLGGGPMPSPPQKELLASFNVDLQATLL